jgi:hypothetical protein
LERIREGGEGGEVAMAKFSVYQDIDNFGMTHEVVARDPLVLAVHNTSRHAKRPNRRK